MFEFNGEYPAVHPKVKFSRFLLKSCKNSAVKHSIQKPILLNFVNCIQPFVQDCWLKIVALVWMWLTTEKRDVSSAKSLQFKEISLGKS